MMARALQLWRRRYWRADPLALTAFDGLVPLKVVTGGSEGIGFALAAGFLRLGDPVLLIGRQADKLSAAAAALAKVSERASVHTLALDVTAADATGVIDAKLAALGGYCDVLVNAAGVGAAGAFTSNDPARLHALVALNMGALTQLSRHYLDGMLVRGRGGLLNVSSVGGFAPGPNQAAYYASKSYVTSLTEALAMEYAGRGVRIAVVAPGPVQTAFHERMGAERGLYLKLLPVLSAEAVARSALWRFRFGQRVIVPGVINGLMMVALRVLPHRLSGPIVGLLIDPGPIRQDRANDQS